LEQSEKRKKAPGGACKKFRFLLRCYCRGRALPRLLQDSRYTEDTRSGTVHERFNCADLSFLKTFCDSVPFWEVLRVKARRLLIESIHNLLREHTAEQITIDRILCEAGVSRTSFYRQFKDKYDLINCFYIQEIEGVLRQIDGLHWRDLMRAGLSMIEKDKEFFRNAFRSAGQNSFPEIFYLHSAHLCRERYKRVAKKPACPSDIDALIRLYCHGCVETTRMFANCEISVPAGQLAGILYDAMPEKLQRYLGAPACAAGGRAEAAEREGGARSEMPRAPGS
jgi:AcrR family transcriptional regulator